jgi:hypothetical protein
VSPREWRGLLGSRSWQRAQESGSECGQTDEQEAARSCLWLHRLCSIAEEESLFCMRATHRRGLCDRFGASGAMRVMDPCRCVATVDPPSGQSSYWRGSVPRQSWEDSTAGIHTVIDTLPRRWTATSRPRMGPNRLLRWGDLLTLLETAKWGMRMIGRVNSPGQGGRGLERDGCVGELRAAEEAGRPQATGAPDAIAGRSAAARGVPWIRPE